MLSPKVVEGGVWLQRDLHIGKRLGVSFVQKGKMHHFCHFSLRSFSRRRLHYGVDGLQLCKSVTLRGRCQKQYIT